MDMRDETTEHKLTRVYVALAMTRQVAQRCVIDSETSQSMLSLIDVANQILEEVLDTSSSPTERYSSSTPTELEMVM